MKTTIGGLLLCAVGFSLALSKKMASQACCDSGFPVSVNHVDQGEEINLDGLTVYKSGDPATAKAGVLVRRRRRAKAPLTSVFLSRFQLTALHFNTSEDGVRRKRLHVED